MSDNQVIVQKDIIKAAKAETDQFFYSHQTIPYAFRDKQLENFEKVFINAIPDIEAALRADLNKSAFEAYMTEIGLVLDEVKFIRKHLKKWMKCKRMPAGLTQQPGTLSIHYNPYGTVLIMSPWNYPVLLTLSPLIGAIAAGNTVIVKPSAYAKNSADMIKKICEMAFPPGLCKVILGGRLENHTLLEEKFDYIFFTGSVNVGKEVMRHASENLTPITLELGGKSPCIIDRSADLKASAKRLAFAKFVNAGQTCVAPDYVLLDESVKDEFMRYLTREFLAVTTDKDYFRRCFPAIINQKHLDRLAQILSETPPQTGGKIYVQRRQIEPAIIFNPPLKSKVMQEEIFGPVLPIITIKSWLEAADFIRQRPRPLALYLFTDNQKAMAYYRDNVSYGGGCINDALIHLSSPKAPFGGIGNSGIGQYHGKDSFVTFSHPKTLVKKAWFGDISLRYHPYTKKKYRFLRKILG